VDRVSRGVVEAAVMVAHPVSSCGEVYRSDCYDQEFKTDHQLNQKSRRLSVRGLTRVPRFHYGECNVLYDWAPPTSVVDKMDGFDE
jgi:hypothetical protein